MIKIDEAKINKWIEECTKKNVLGLVFNPDNLENFDENENFLVEQSELNIEHANGLCLLTEQ